MADIQKDFAAQLADRWSVQVLDPRRPGVRAAIEGAVREALAKADGDFTNCDRCGLSLAGIGDGSGYGITRWPRYCSLRCMENKGETEKSRDDIIVAAHSQDFIAARRFHVFSAINAERDRQDELYPKELVLPYALEPSDSRKALEAIARNSCDQAQREGRLTHDHILDEETAECLAAETRADKRKEAVQAAASFVKLIEQIDREIEEEKSRG